MNLISCLSYKLQMYLISCLSSRLQMYLISWWLSHGGLYVWLQVGRPSLKCNAAQLVLKYALLYRKDLCNTWRSRIYYYSSATTFSDVCDDVKVFVESNPRGRKLLRNLKDVGLCREVVGDALVSFIRRKPSFFKDAMLSKRHFWTIPKWKRTEQI